MQATIVNIFDVGDYEAQIQAAAELLREGGVVVVPTETVYGAAGVLTDARATGRLRALHPDSNGGPMTIHLAHRDQAIRYIGKTSELGLRMMKKLWPGPVGIVFPVEAEHRAKVCAELSLPVSEIYHNGTVTLRCPDHSVATDVLSAVDAPVVITRATEADQFAEELTDKVDLILDAGATRYHKPSTLVRVDGDSYTIVREGVYDQRIIERLLQTTILFVCSGNTCRSPMAEGLAKLILSEKLGVNPQDLASKGITVLSAGSFAMPGARATAQAIEALGPMGADISKHRSRPLSVELIHQADVVFAMGKSHAQAVRLLVPSASEKVVTLDPDGDIEDPIGGNARVYVELAGVLRKLIERRLEEFQILK